MAERQPSAVKNPDIYGSPALEWSRARDILPAPGYQTSHFLGTVGPDGRPHAAAVGAIWHDGDFYLVSGPGARKSRRLAANPACSISVALQGIDLVCEGEAARITGGPALEQVAALYREQGWPVQVKGDAFTAPYSAPSAGSAPWNLYRFTYHTVYGVATEEPHGATCWRFDR